MLIYYSLSLSFLPYFPPCKYHVVHGSAPAFLPVQPLLDQQSSSVTHWRKQIPTIMASECLWVVHYKPWLWLPGTLFPSQVPQIVLIKVWALQLSVSICAPSLWRHSASQFYEQDLYLLDSAVLTLPNRDINSWRGALSKISVILVLSTP